jgi:hypothetical protein
VNNVVVFYSWQSDRLPKVTRNLIERALERALKKVSEKLHVTLILDQDARGESGSPSIPDTIQGKIRKAAVFVADLTIVAQREGTGGLPNGCVSVEWGWAEIALGSIALIGVMNTTYGGPGDLPVDIRQNLVRVTYNSPETNTDDELKAERYRVADRLALEVERSIRARFFQGFHEDAPQLVRHLVEGSSEGTSRQRFAPRDLAAQAGISEAAALAIMEDLVRCGMAVEAGHAGGGFMIRCLPTLYMHFDPLFMAWNADQDAVILASELVKRGRERLDVLSQELGWSPRRINPAILRLLHAEFANASNENPGGSPFARVDVYPNASTRALAEGRAALPPIAPRAQFRVQ